MNPVFSVVVPAYNEEEVLPQSFERLDAVLRGMGEPYELIFVDDGSRDGTADILRDLAAAHSQVRTLHFSRNFGHQVAVSAGVDAARGDAIVIIDCDLQDPPELIPLMAEKWREGYEVVYGKRSQRDGETAMKKLTAWGFYRVLRGMSGVPIPADTGDFRLIDRRVADVLRAMPEHRRFLRGLFAWMGFRQTEVLFHRSARFAGETKYTLKKMLRLAGDGILSFSDKPVLWLLAGGVGFTALGAVWLLVRLILALCGHAGAIASLAGLMIFLCGLVLTGMGVLGMYITRSYDEVQGRPLYIVAEKHGFDEGEKEEECQ